MSCIELVRQNSLHFNKSSEINFCTVLLFGFALYSLFLNPHLMMVGLAMELLDVLVQCMISFEDVVAEVAHEFGGSTWYGWRMGE